MQRRERRGKSHKSNVYGSQLQMIVVNLAMCIVQRVRTSEYIDLHFNFFSGSVRENSLFEWIRHFSHLYLKRILRRTINNIALIIWRNIMFKLIAPIWTNVIWLSSSDSFKDSFFESSQIYFSAAVTMSRVLNGPAWYAERGSAVSAVSCRTLVDLMGFRVKQQQQQALSDDPVYNR